MLSLEQRIERLERQVARASIASYQGFITVDMGKLIDGFKSPEVLLEYLDSPAYRADVRSCGLQDLDAFNERCGAYRFCYDAIANKASNEADD